MSEEIQYTDINKSFEAAVERSRKIEEDLIKILKNTAFLPATVQQAFCISATILVHYRIEFVLQILAFLQ